MDRQERSNVGLGVILILVGAFFLARLFFPGLHEWLDIAFEWPMYVIGVGVLLLLIGLLVGAPGMAVPASIVGGIGGILYWQNTTGNWESWAYIWTLIPGFAGVGTLVMGLLGENPRESIKGGISAIIVSLILFAIFSSFLGGPAFMGQYWPVLVILLGLWILARNIFRSRRAG